MTASLASLLGDVEVLEVVGELEGTGVTLVTQSSDAVVPGALYCCVPGAHVDGHDLAPQVIAAGAGSLLVERVLAVGVPQVLVPSTRSAVAPVAAAFYGQPSRALSVVGITGTNGKTTTTHLLAAIAETAGRPAGLIGTLSGARTTPEAPVLQATLAQMRDDGVDVVAMEVSSMALDQHRADAISFAVAVWTNLSQDHLDYHGSMDAYFEAKASLFAPGRAAAAVVNVDDPAGRRLLARIDPAASPVQTFTLDDAEDLEAGLSVSRFRWRGHPVTLHLGGAHNVSNALAAASAAERLGIAPSAVADGLNAIQGVAGRFEAVDAGQPFTVLVDYAHTPDGLERVLTAVRPHNGQARVTVVFGCGGDRDRAKRPRMAAVASRLADRVVLTSDNPRSEDPDAIIAEARAGAVRPEVVTVEPDRGRAIELAVSGAHAGDVVVIAGKGHETGQDIAGTIVPFDDRLEALAALAALGYINAGAA